MGWTGLEITKDWVGYEKWGLEVEKIMMEEKNGREDGVGMVDLDRV